MSGASAPFLLHPPVILFFFSLLLLRPLAPATYFANDGDFFRLFFDRINELDPFPFPLDTRFFSPACFTSALVNVISRPPLFFESFLPPWSFHSSPFIPVSLPPSMFHHVSFPVVPLLSRNSLIYCPGYCALIFPADTSHTAIHATLI